MENKKVIMIIEASKDGFWIYSEEDFPCNAYGETIKAAKEDLQEVMKEMLDFYKEEGREPDPSFNNGNLEFVYTYDIDSIKEHWNLLNESESKEVEKYIEEM